MGFWLLVPGVGMGGGGDGPAVTTGRVVVALERRMVAEAVNRRLTAAAVENR